MAWKLHGATGSRPVETHDMEGEATDIHVEVAPQSSTRLARVGAEEKAGQKLALKPTLRPAVPVIITACSVFAIVAVKMIQRSFKRLRSQLLDTERACEELTVVCRESQAKIDELVKSLEEKTNELAEKERCLEQMRVEQQLSKSMASMVERELKTTKKLLASYQGQLDQATYVLKESNRQNENANTPGAYGFTGGFWG